MKDFKELKYFQRIEVAHSGKGIFISHRKYMLGLLHETGKLKCKPTSEKERAKVDKGQYHRLMGKSIYLTHIISHLTYPINMVIQFMHDLRVRHLQAVERILQYLKATQEREILFKRGGIITMDAYIDGDYVGLVIIRRFTSGYCTFMFQDV